MKNKIAIKLTLYFAAALLLFSLIIGGVFLMLFQKQTIDIHKNDLKERALSMASTLSQYMDGKETGMGMGGGQGGYGAYLRFLDDIAMADVWIVDENLELLTYGHMENKQYNYADLPADADSVVKGAFEGKTYFSEGFSGLLQTPTLTIGTPIVSKGKVVGALLLHSPVDGMNAAIAQGVDILVISIAIALTLSVLLSIALAVAFTKPLKRMKNTAVKLAGGDYSARTNVLQNDEIGELALSIDVLSERLDLASHESEQLEKLRRDFVANISHELRTPVTVLRGSLESLCDDVVTDPELVKTYHRQMLRESMHLQRLVNDLLDLSRLQNTDFKMDMQAISLCEVLGDVVRSVRNMAKAKNIRIELEQDSQLCAITGDYGRLRQMLLVFLDNAVKFSNQDSIVTVTLEGKTLSIMDHGIGIAAEDLPYIFDRFYKTKSEQNKNGTGLGLAIAKQIADRHGIALSVSSRQNEYTEFKLQF